MKKEVKEWLTEELRSWLTTWAEEEEPDYPDFLEEIIVCLETNRTYKFTQEAYDEILFHLWQKYSDGG